MNSYDEIMELVALANELKLDGRDRLHKYTISELSKIYNGIGPDSFPDWLRATISALHPSLAVVAFLHDVEWHESDDSHLSFKLSNDRFKSNGYCVAKAKFAWYDPRRYIVMNQARRFGNICQALGWSAWTSPCQCEICRNKG